MYRNANNGQSSIYDFILPFGGHLNEDNRWVKLRSMIDWKMIDEEYSGNFKNKDNGNEAYPADVAFGDFPQTSSGRDHVQDHRKNVYKSR